jgi:hypothetical protein
LTAVKFKTLPARTKPAMLSPRTNHPQRFIRNPTFSPFQSPDETGV